MTELTFNQLQNIHKLLIHIDGRSARAPGDRLKPSQPAQAQAMKVIMQRRRNSP